ncbi:MULTISPECIES: hypothetical protein [Kitasatospora]|uniref:CBS domain-containing protein n=1 Tax=Kitasatospora cystarginea TaxID=58350 RepID=A0ABN3DY16_9ACTN
MPHVLARLSDCGFVDGMHDAFRPGVAHYRIAEPLLAFDHAVIRPHRSALERQEAAAVWRSVRPAFDSSVLVLSLAGVDALVVADEYGQLVGLVTAGDLAAALAGRPRAWRKAQAEGVPRKPRGLLPGLPPRPQDHRTGVP